MPLGKAGALAYGGGSCYSEDVPLPDERRCSSEAALEETPRTAPRRHDLGGDPYLRVSGSSQIYLGMGNRRWPPGAKWGLFSFGFRCVIV